MLYKIDNVSYIVTVLKINEWDNIDNLDSIHIEYQ